MRDAFAISLHEIAKDVQNVYIVVADISPAASMQPFRDQFPERFINVGVAEQAMISLCAGLALRGCKPFAYTIATFSIYRPFEHIRVELCYQNLPVTIVGVGAGLSYSVAGATHNAIEDIGVMSALPNMSIIAPCDPNEVRSAVRACINNTGPTYLRLGKAGEINLTNEAPDPFIFGKIRKIKDGNNIAILGYGPILAMAFEASAIFKEKSGIQASIYSVHTLKPLDRARIELILRSYAKIIIIEEATNRGGLAAQIKEIAWDTGARCEIRCIGLKDKFIKCYGTKEELLAAHGVTVAELINNLYI
jgi:transketolase